MDLDSLKKKSRMVTAPGREPSVRPAGVFVDDLISRLKREDEKERKQLRKALPFWIIAAIIFVVAFVAVVISGSGIPSSALLLRGLTATLFVIVVVGLFLRLKMLRKIDYGEAVLPFLQKSAKRYEFSPAWFYFFAASVTLYLAYGAYIYMRDVFHRTFGVHNSFTVLAGTVAFFGIVYAVGFWATRKEWKETKEPILREIRMMLRELGEE